MSQKLQIGLREQNFFEGKESVSENFDFIERFKNEKKDKNFKICSRFYDPVSRKLDFPGYNLHRAHPPALNLKFSVPKKS